MGFLPSTLPVNIFIVSFFSIPLLPSTHTIMSGSPTFVYDFVSTLFSDSSFGQSFLCAAMLSLAARSRIAALSLV